MTDDRSLDDFLDGGEGDETAASDAAESGADAEGDARTDDAGTDDADDAPDGADSGTDSADAPDPARATAAFDPDGAACESCGESVTRRWRDDGAWVCADCKAW